MRRWVGWGIAMILCAPTAFGASLQGDASARAVAALFERSCVSCHGTGSTDPRASRAWSGASDLVATAANLEQVTPGEPKDSNLYLVVDFDDMPPADAGGPLSTEDKATLATWIREGAPALAPESQGSAETSDIETQSADSEEVESSQSWLQARGFRWLSHFHPAIVHFPIALLMAAALAALLARFSSHEGLQTATTFCLWMGAVSAPPAAALGWLLAANSSHRGDDLELHRWLGVSVAVLSMVALYIQLRRPKWLLPVLFVLAALVGITGHTGGSLTFGPTWFDWPQ
tara:strand:+ start:5546 stop:6409 length:864 start_codon:yes stop_codon:yes gene_type:complete